MTKTIEECNTEVLQFVNNKIANLQDTVKIKKILGCGGYSECYSEIKIYEIIRQALQPSPKSAEVEEAIKKASHKGHRIRFLMHPDDMWILETLIKAARQPQKDVHTSVGEGDGLTALNLVKKFSPNLEQQLFIDIEQALLRNHSQKKDVSVLVEALKMARKELLVTKDDAYCEHEVGICSCMYWNTLSCIDKALKAFGEVV